MQATVLLRRIKLCSITFFLSLFYLSSWSQLDYTHNFSNWTGWTTTGTWTSGTVCGADKRINIWSSQTSGSCHVNTGTATGSVVNVSFDYSATNYSDGSATSASHVSLLVQSSTDASTWTTRYTLSHTPSTSCQTKTFSFTPASGTVYIRFLAAQGNAAADYYLDLDNLSVVEASSLCTPKPTALTSSAVDPTSQTISWTAASSGATRGYQYYVSTSSTVPISSTTPTGSVSAGTTSATLTGLTPATTYYYWVRSYCNSVDYSGWTSTSSFTTASYDETWEGDVSTDWDTPGNWSGNYVPLYQTNVTIPSGTPFACVIAAGSDPTCNNLTVNTGAILTVGTNTYALDIWGNLVNNGTIDHTGNIWVYMEGTSVTWSGNGSYLDFGMYIDYLSNVTLLSNATIDYLELYSSTTTGISLGSNYLTVTYKLIQRGIMNLGTGTIEFRGPSSMHSIHNGRLLESTGLYYYNGIDYSQLIRTADYYNLKVATKSGNTATIGNSAVVNVQNDFTLCNPSTAGGVATTAYDISVGNNVLLGTTGNALTFNLANRLYRASGTGTLTMGNITTHAVNISYATDPTLTAISGFGNPTFYGTVTYISPSSQLVLGTSYYNLTGDDVGVKTALGAITATNNFLLNNGTFDLTTSNYALNVGGNFTNNGTFTGRNSTVTFNGTTSQTLGGTNACTFYNTTLNNSAGLIVSKGPTVSNLLTFSSGNMTAASSTEPVTLDVSATVSGPANGKCIVGYCKKNTTSISKFTFPVGSSTNYRPAAVTPSSTSATSWLVKYFNNGYSDLSTVNTTGTLNHVSSQEYWTIDRTGSANATIELSWNSQSGVSNILDMVVAHYNGADWHSAGGNSQTGSTSSGTVSSNTGWSSYSPFTLGSITSSSALPVELLWVKMNCASKQLEWATASEHLSDRFMLSYSRDGESFEPIGEVTAAGESSSELNYTFEINATGGYVQLQQMDQDGKVETYPIVAVTCERGDMILYPNPVQYELVVEWVDFESSEKMHLSVQDAFGKKVLEQELNPKDRSQLLDVRNIASGMYTLTITDGNTSITKKFVVK